jgi:hypothetical protein
MFVWRLVFRLNENQMKIFITTKYQQMTAIKDTAMHSLRYITILQIAGSIYL